MMDKNIRLIPPACADQRCLMDPSTSEKFKLKHGDFCEIRINDDVKLVCTVRFKHDETREIQCSNMVSLYPASTTTNSKTKNIRKLQRKSLQNATVGVNIILNDENSDKRNLFTCVRQVLLQLGFCLNSTINCSSFPQCRIMGIEKIIIDEIIPPPSSENCVFTISDDFSSIEINKILKISTKKNSKRDENIKLGGLDRQYRQIEDIILFSNTNLLIHGPPGTGKTSLIKSITANLNIELLYQPCSNLIHPYPGETVAHIRQIFEKSCGLSISKRCVLFLDEIDCVGSKYDRSSNAEYGIRCQLRSILKEAKNFPNLSIIGAAKEIDDLHTDLRSSNCFVNEILLNLPDVEQRAAILELFFDGKKCENLDFQKLAQCTPGYSGADLRLLYQQLTQRGNKEISQEEFLKLISTFSPASKRNDLPPEKSSIKWDDIGGLEDFKTTLRRMIDLSLNNPLIPRHYGIPYPKGILLYGPPGCCKTTLIRAMANDLKISFYSTGPAQVYSPFLGESEKAITQIFRQARSTFPSIVFIDELDALVGSRTEGVQSDVHAKVLATLLNEMDGIGIRSEVDSGQSDVIVMAATNRPDLIDAALLRPGRLDALVYVPPPDKEARKSILNVILQKMPVRDVDVDGIAENTEYFSGADLKNLCNEAALYAMEDEGPNVEFITQKHFHKVLADATPSLTKSQVEFYDKYNKK